MTLHFYRAQSVRTAAESPLCRCAAVQSLVPQGRDARPKPVVHTPAQVDRSASGGHGLWWKFYVKLLKNVNALFNY